MKDKKVISVLLVICVVFFLVMFLSLGVNNISRGKYNSTIIIGEKTVWIFQEGKWYNIQNYSSLQELSWREYNVFDDNKNIGKYSLWYDDKWYVFDNNKNAISINGNLLALNSN